MAIKLLFTAMDSHLYRSHPRLKIMLMSLCNFADEFGSGKMWNGTMSRHIGAGEEQVRRYKRRLEEDGICIFNYKRGKGRFTSFQLDLLQLEIAINQTDERGKMPPQARLAGQVTPPTGGVSGGNLTPPTGGVTGEVTPPHTEVTPPTAPKTPTSSGGVKRERTLKGGLRSATSHFDDIGPLARHWRTTLEKHKGPEWIKSWLVDEQITESPHGVVVLVKNAFGKSSVERVLETLTGGATVEVMVSPKRVSANV